MVVAWETFRDREILSSCKWLIILFGSTERQSNLCYFCVYFTSCRRRVECGHGLHANNPQFAVLQWDNCTARGGEQSVRCRCAIHNPVQYRRASSIWSKSGSTSCRHYVPNSFPKKKMAIPGRRYSTYGPITLTWCLTGTLLPNFTTPCQILPSSVVVCDAEQREMK